MRGELYCCDPNAEIPMPKLTTAQLTKAAKLFLASNPAAAVRILSITPADADFMETSLHQLQLDRTMAEIDRYAHENGRDAMEMRFSLAAETAEEFEKMWNEHQAIINKNLGL